MRALVLSLLLGACAAPAPADSAVGDTTVTGTVTAVDLAPMTYDGDAVITLDTGGGAVTVHVPARETQCEAEGLDLIVRLAVGDRVEVVGAREGGAVRPCLSADHRITRIGVADTPDAGRGVFRGVYLTAFEASDFSPCDRPNERWWLTPNEAFGDALAAIRAEHPAEQGRGAVLYVEATVEGTLSDEGRYGHLGVYERELTVTGVRDLVFLASGTDATPTCR